MHRRERDPGDTAGGQPLRPDAGRREPQELGVRGDEHEVVVLGRLGRADDRVARLEADRDDLGLVRPRAGDDALHDALGGADRDGVVEPGDESATVSVRATPRYSDTRTPASSRTEAGGTAGTSTGENRTTRPVDVSAPS